MINLLYSTFLLLTSLHMSVAGSVRLGSRRINQRELGTINVIRTFSTSIVASQPANPANATPCVLLNLKGSNMDWINKTYPNETVISMTPLTIFTAGSTWPGGRRLTTKRCNYICVTQQIMTCRLCGARKLDQQHRTTHSAFNNFFSNTFSYSSSSNSGSTISSSSGSTWKANVTSASNGTIATSNVTFTSNTKATSATSSTVVATGSAVNNTNITTSKELYLLEDVLKFLLPLVCPEFKNITSVIVTLAEQVV